MASINPAFVMSTVRVSYESGSGGGTGFVIARPDKYIRGDLEENDAGPWRGWIVTCAHVIDGAPGTTVDVEINEESTGGKAVPIKFSISDNWTKPIVWEQRQSTLGPIGSRSYEPLDASVDVAVAQAPLRLVRENGLDLWGFPPKTHLTKELLRKDKIADQPLNEGDDVFIIGFPTGHDKDSKNWPVVRSGVVAQIQPYLRSNALTFLVDGSVFPGNSGGPVVTKPRALDIDGTEKLKKNALIGMVSGYRTASLGGENADLGIVVPLNAIHDTIDLALNNLGVDTRP